MKKGTELMPPYMCFNVSVVKFCRSAMKIFITAMYGCKVQITYSRAANCLGWLIMLPSSVTCTCASRRPGVHYKWIPWSPAAVYCCPVRGRDHFLPGNRVASSQAFAFIALASCSSLAGTTKAEMSPWQYYLISDSHGSIALREVNCYTWPGML